MQANIELTKQKNFETDKKNLCTELGSYATSIMSRHKERALSLIEAIEMTNTYEELKDLILKQKALLEGTNPYKTAEQGCFYKQDVKNNNQKGFYTIISRWATVLKNLPSPNTDEEASASTSYDEEIVALGRLPKGTQVIRECSGSYANLLSIILPEEITEIEPQAFKGCTNIYSITLPRGVKTIGNDAFYGCSALTSITLPEGVEAIGDNAFSRCSALTSITLPRGVKTIDSDAFSRCSALTSITLPESVETIGDLVFFGCSALTSITLPESVETIGDFVFVGCSALISITLPRGLKTIGHHAFFGCSALTSITLPESIETIGFYAFKNCPNLSHLIIDSNNRKEIEKIRELVGIAQIQVISKPEAIECNMLIREGLTKTSGVHDQEKLIEDVVLPIMRQTFFLRFFNSANEAISSNAEPQENMKLN